MVVHSVISVYGLLCILMSLHLFLVRLMYPYFYVFIDRIYQMCPSISIDYGIMEKAVNVSTVLSDFGWSDLGTWGSLYTHIPHDVDANAVVGNNVHLYDSKDCVVNVPKDKLVVLQGLEDYIVVEANDVLFVCKKKDEQSIKKYVSDIKANKR